MIKIDVFVKYKNWKKYISNPHKHIKSKAKYLNNSIKFIKNKKINFSILLAGNKEIKYLNRKFRGKNKATDVLSFPFYDAQDIKKLKNKNIYLGDVIINFNKIEKSSFKNNFDKLWVHGFLHLLGYKHFKEKDYNKMNQIEKLILNKIKSN